MWSRIRGLAGCLRQFPARIVGVGLVASWPFRAVLSNDEPDDPSVVTKKLFARSLWHIVHSEFADADRELHRLLYHLAESYRHQQIDSSTYTEQRGRICSELASVNLILGNYSQAEALIKQTVHDCVRSGLDITDAVIVELSLKLALIYERLGRLEECAIGFRYCIGTQERKLASGSVTGPEQLANEKALLGMSYNYFSQFLYTQNELTSALGYARKALSVALDLYPATHPNCIHIESDVITMLTDLNQLDEARSALKHLLARHEDKRGSARPVTLGQSKPETADENLANEEIRCQLLLQFVLIEIKSGDLTNAKRRYTEAETVCNKLPITADLQTRMQKTKRACHL